MSNQTTAQAKAKLAFIKECMDSLTSVSQRKKAFARLSEEDAYLFQMEYEGYFMGEELNK